MKAISPDRLKRFAAAIAVIVIGVTLRLTGYEVGLPYGFVKYGGSLLWGVMVYLLVTVILPDRPRLQLFISVMIAVAAELLRLYHTPWLDEFRLTLAGGAAARANLLRLEHRCLSVRDRRRRDGRPRSDDPPATPLSKKAG